MQTIGLKLIKKITCVKCKKVLFVGKGSKYEKNSVCLVCAPYFFQEQDLKFILKKDETLLEK